MAEQIIDRMVSRMKENMHKMIVTIEITQCHMIIHDTIIIENKIVANIITAVGMVMEIEMTGIIIHAEEKAKEMMTIHLPF